MKMKVQEASYEPIDNGSYIARFDGIELVNGQYGEACKLTFTIVGGSYEGRRINWIVSNILREGSKLYRFVQTISDTDIETGQEIDFDILTGRICTIVTERRTQGNNTYSNVSMVLHYKAGSNQLDDDEDDNTPF